MHNQRNMIAIIGVDGSGKSTVIEQIHQRLLNEGFSAEVLTLRKTGRHFPGLLNYGRPVRSPLISVLKVLWRAVKWNAIYYFKLASKIRQGHLVIFDRFYFDEILIDPLKYRFSAPAWTARFIHKLVPSPNLYILLDAPKEVLYARKQEMTLEEVGHLRQAYLTWINQLDHAYCVDAQNELDLVIEQVHCIILDNLAAFELHGLTSPE